MLRVFTLLHLVFVLLQGSAALGNEKLSGTMEGIKKKYAHLPGLTITYTREVITRSMSMLGNQVKGDLATGRIYFKPPYFMKLEQETPEPETITTDGDTLWWYIPGKKRVYQYSCQKFGKELLLLSDIFRGLTKVEESFQVRMVTHNAQGKSQIELSPDPTWEGVDRILLTIENDYDIRIVEIQNQLGSITRFTLKDLSIKENFENGFFKFVIPEGVQLLEEGVNES